MTANEPLGDIVGDQVWHGRQGESGTVYDHPIAGISSCPVCVKYGLREKKPVPPRPDEYRIIWNAEGIKKVGEKSIRGN
jgi:hypothetical protein